MKNRRKSIIDGKEIILNYMGSKEDFLKKEIKELLTEWHIGTEDMFDEEDLEAMTADIMEIIKNQKLK